VVAEQYPWPAGDGYRQRLDHMIRGLAAVGEVEVHSLYLEGTAEAEPPPVDGVTAPRVVRARIAGGAGARAATWLRDDMPRRMVGPDWSAVRSSIEESLSERGPFDLVWFSHVETWRRVHDLLRGVPSVADFDNLENLALRLRRRIPPRSAPGSGPLARARTLLRWGGSRTLDLVDERRWDRLQQQCAAEVDRVVVCSELDVVRSGCSNAVVVPNGSEAPPGAVTDRRRLRGAVPTFLFVGALDYEPNAEAVEWFVRDVFPHVRRRVPEARLRLVGRGRSNVAWVADEPGVELVGAVDDIAVELRGADVSLVPIRVGAGTRLKVVEALANRIPLVTTTVGCEGIDVTDGLDALIEDGPEDFADACVRLAGDGGLRQRIADAGARLFDGRYEWARIEEHVARLASEVVSSSARG
jgi:polysaccharide biosynthesis protein PslH